MNPQKLKERPMLAPSVTKYKTLEEEMRWAAWETKKALHRLAFHKLQLTRTEASITGAQVHKIRAQRRYLYTPEECAARLAEATTERFPNK